MTGISRRDFHRIVGGGAMIAALGRGIGGALAQPPACGLPATKAVRVTTVALVVNSVTFSGCTPKKPVMPPLSVGIAHNLKQGVDACTIELAPGINIRAAIALQALAGPHPSYFGKLGFVQFVQYRHQRSPAGTQPNGNFACARSSTWELDGNDPYNGYVNCAAGLNRASMADDPGVPTEDARTAYDTVRVFPWDRFQTWLVWQETENGRPESPTNRARRYPLARIDWMWKGDAGLVPAAGASCASAQGMHPGDGWNGRGMAAAVTNVLIGPAAAAPPLKYLRAHGNAWIPGAC